MGRDIHLFAEYPDGPRTFVAVSDGAFLLPRDHGLFAALAGVGADEGFVPLARYPGGLLVRQSSAAPDTSMVRFGLEPSGSMMRPSTLQTERRAVGGRPLTAQIQLAVVNLDEGGA